MSFDGNAVESDAEGLEIGEVITGHVNNSDAFVTFEDGLIIGRFAKYDTGSLDNLDASVTPTIAGVVKRNLTGSLKRSTYNNVGDEINTDDVAELCNFGYVTVEIKDGITPVKYEAVYAENKTVGDYGEATNILDTSNILVPGATFHRATNRANVWIIKLGQIL